jgi:tetraprenyl-beta-curcumene synthase
MEQNREPHDRRLSARGRGLGLGECVRYAGAFVFAAVRYWTAVFPRAAVELRRWRRRAALITDPTLRRLALEALDKRGNIEGAAAFATFVPWRQQRMATRALVAFQAAYNHVDLLAEQPHKDPVAHARCLHQALLVALDPAAAQPDYYVLDCDHDDGGYLAEIVERCRVALHQLPAHGAVAAPIRRAGANVVAFQSLSLGGREQFEHWARAQAADSRLKWWEAAAAGGSSLGVHALIAAAATPSLSATELAAIEDAYLADIGALHSLLDSLVDRAEDAATGQLSLVGCYRSSLDAATRMRSLTASALEAARTLPGGRRHQLLVAAMACHYLSSLERATAETSEPAQAVREVLGGLAAPALAVFRARRLAGRLARARTRVGGVQPDLARRVDARAA